jgi:Alginate export
MHQFNQHMKRKRHMKTGALFAAALFAGKSLSALAGEVVTDKTAVVEPRQPENPLCFLDGKICFDLEERFRWEIRDNNFDFDDAVNALTDDNWFLQRARIGLLIKPCDWFRIYAQGQDSREINSDRPDLPSMLGAEGDDTFDLRQGWAEFGNPKSFPLTLKVGRQVLSYGDERLIGAFDWNNIGRTFDAVKLRWEEKTWWLDAFASSVVVPERGSYDQSDLFNGNETHREQLFSGLYFSTTAWGPQTTDLYALYLHENPNAKFQPTASGDTNFATLGLRIKSKPGAFAHTQTAPDGKAVTDGKSAPPPPSAPKAVGFDYEFEGAFQTGEVLGRDLTAFAVHGGLGYTFDVAWKPRLGVEYNYGSGDDDPLAGDIETFQNLFPTNHKFYGQMDVFSWQNMHDAAVIVKAQPVKSVTLKAEYHAFWLASTDDVWYRANGTTAVRPLDALARKADNYAGSEVDVTAQWAVNKHVAFEAGYSHFFAGDYLSDTGASDDADFGYVQASLTF